MKVKNYTNHPWIWKLTHLIDNDGLLHILNQGIMLLHAEERSSRSKISVLYSRKSPSVLIDISNEFYKAAFIIGSLAEFGQKYTGCSDQKCSNSLSRSKPLAFTVK